MFQFSLLGMTGLAAVLMCCVLAVVLFRVGTAGSVARKLALLLLVEGFVLGSSTIVERLFSPEITANWTYESGVLRYLFITHTFADCLMLALYPGFLAAALHTKLTRPFARKPVQMLVYTVSAMLFIAVQISPLELGATLLYAILSLCFSFAMVVSIHAWLTTAPGIARDRARSFALAFGIRDICWGFVYAISIYDIAVGSYMSEVQFRFIDYIYYLGTLIYVPIVAYGILRTQLFDIDLRIRWTIKQSTVAGVFVAVMFVISEGTSQFLSDELGNVAGLLAAGVVMFFLTPLQRFAERVAGTAMPNTKNTTEYTTFRKMQVYEAAVAEAQQEGGISHKERSLLVRLRDSLEISESDAESIEQELQTHLQVLS
jgi:hypothetical protein